MPRNVYIAVSDLSGLASVEIRVTPCVHMSYVVSSPDGPTWPKKRQTQPPYRNQTGTRVNDVRLADEAVAGADPARRVQEFVLRPRDAPLS